MGKFRCLIGLEPLPGLEFEIVLNVINENSLQVDIIIGRDFLQQHRLMLVNHPTRSVNNTNLELFPANLLNLNVLSIQESKRSPGIKLY